MTAEAVSPDSSTRGYVGEHEVVLPDVPDEDDQLEEELESLSTAFNSIEDRLNDMHSRYDSALQKRAELDERATAECTRAHADGEGDLPEACRDGWHRPGPDNRCTYCKASLTITPLHPDLMALYKCYQANSGAAR